LYRKVPIAESEIEGRLNLLPRKGYKCITVSEKIHEDIRKRASETDRTMKEYIEYLLAKEKDAKEGK
jgi:hypothetical protein